jgi:hypothetical protein
VLLADLVDEVAAYEATEEGADEAAVAETGLPRGGELMLAVVVNVLTVALGEPRESIEITNEDGIVAFVIYLMME